MRDQKQKTTVLESELQKRILMLDGAMGTMIQAFRFDEADFRNNFV